MFPFLDPMYFIFVGPALVLGLWAQFRVKHAYGKYSRVAASSGMTGAEAAHHMLRAAGVGPLAIERVGGQLSDHYDPRHKVLRLSHDVHDGRSIAAVGIACHEAGHAIQDARKYAPLVLRNAIVPTANIGSSVGIIMIVLGAMISTNIAILGLMLFGTVVVFQLINLPVEFNASSRAKEALMQSGIIHGREEAAGVASVLDAAALTYVAATLQTLSVLLYYAYIILGNTRR